MNIFILRHGIAVDPSSPDYPDDAQRPLTSKGRRRLREIVAAMRAMKLSFDVILSSPYVRTRQTAEVAAKFLKRRKSLKFSDHLTPGGNPKLLVQELVELQPVPKAILLVGHEPYLSRFITLLTAGSTHMEMDLKKGGLCQLEADTLAYGRCATLVSLLAPRHMALMAGKRPAR